MPTYRVELLGRKFDVDAENQGKALGMARLHVAKASMIEGATEQATARAKPARDLAILQGVRSRAGSFGIGPTQEDISAGREANIPALTLGAMVAGPAIAGAIAAPASTAAAVGTGYVGSEVGARAGGKVGKIAESLGAPEGTAGVLRSGGELAGGLAGGIGGVKALSGILGRFATPTEQAVLANVLKRAESAAAKGVASSVVPAAPAAGGAIPIPSAKALQAIASTAQREALTVGATKEQAQEAAKAAVTAAIRNETPAVLPAGSRAMATNLGGPARPGPPPTPPEGIEAALRASLEKGIAKESILKTPRVNLGAQKVGREVGMTKEQVRKVTGPVLDEALGEASPILPKQAFQKIVDTMKAMPMSERDAYVARATSGKAKWQIENIRRTLEHLGLLLPAGVAVGAMAGKERE